MPRLKRFRFPREIISYAVWAYHRFALSTADVEGLLAERGVVVSGEGIRLWINRFGQHFAKCIKRDRPVSADKWHLDEVVISIHGEKYWLWRAIDANGDVLDILVQKHRNTKAANRFLRRLVGRFSEPRVIITDKLRSYIKPIKSVAPETNHRAHKGLNNRIEGSHPLPDSGLLANHERDQRENARKFWVSSNPQGKPRGFSKPMIKLAQSSAHAATASPQFHTATPEPMPPTFGTAMPSK